jgi:hypothetical protein
MWRAARWGVFLLPPVLLAGMAAFGARGGAAVRRLAEHPLNACLFAAGVGLLLLPVADGDLVEGAPADLRRRQAQALLGGWLMGLYAATGAAVFAASPQIRVLPCLSAFALGLCVAMTPLFWRIPWRSLAAAALLAAALSL